MPLLFAYIIFDENLQIFSSRTLFKYCFVEIKIITIILEIYDHASDIT